jgi:acyl dehydratase
VTAPGPAVGQTLLLGRRRATLESFRRYCHGQAPNHHTDPAAAAAIGLPRPLAPGPMLAGYLAEALLHLYGPGWLAGGRLAVAFTGPVWDGDALLLRATVTAREGDRLALALTIDTEDGRRVLGGSAEGRLAPREA